MEKKLKLETVDAYSIASPEDILKKAQELGLIPEGSVVHCATAHYSTTPQRKFKRNGHAIYEVYPKIKIQVLTQHANWEDAHKYGDTLKEVTVSILTNTVTVVESVIKVYVAPSDEDKKNSLNMAQNMFGDNW